MAVQLLPLFVDRSEEDPKQFKAIFIWTKEKGEFVHEFLYLQGGTQEGTWAWGRVGSVNGALLWPPIFNHFAREIFKYTE